MLVNHVGFRMWWRSSSNRYWGNLQPYFDGAGQYQNASSIAKYGDQFRILDTPWLQRGSGEAPTIIKNSLLWRYAFPRWVVSLTAHNPQYLRLERGDYVCWSWQQLHDENGLPLVNQIGRILEITRNPLEGSATLTLLDTGEYYQNGVGERDRTRY